MADQFLGEIRAVGFTFAPPNWAFCDGQLMPIRQNIALFSLLGTTYGGDGTATFGLPNLQGRAPMFWQQGPGLSNHFVGETGGETAVTLLSGQMPMHNHALNGDREGANSANPNGNLPASITMPNSNLYTAGSPSNALASGSVGAVGGNQPHNNLAPYLTLNYIIALNGIFPPRS